MKTPEQIAEEAARIVCEENFTRRAEGEAWLSALCWELGDGMDYESTLRAFANAVIQTDRATHPQIDLEAFLTEYEAYQGDDVGVFIHAWQRGYWITDRIAELTAAWEEATGDTASDYALSGDDWSVGLSDDEAAEITRLIEYTEGGKK